MASYERFQETLKKFKGDLDKNVLVTLFCHEVRLGYKSRLQRAWIVIILFFGLLFALTNHSLDAIYMLMVFYGFLGSMIAVMISSSSVSGELGGIADSLLSKSVQRWEYVLSKYLSQISIVCTVYFLMAALVTGILWNFNFLPDDLNYGNLLFYVVMIALVIVFFSSIGLMFSTIFPKTIFSFLSGILVWFLLIFLFVITQWKFLYSPVELFNNFLPIVEGTWQVDHWKIILFYACSPLLFFIISLLFFYQKDL